MKHTDSTLTEVYPMDLGEFILTDKMGVKLTLAKVQDIFNAPMWKSYYLGDSSRFVAVDHRTGKSQEYKIYRMPS